VYSPRIIQAKLKAFTEKSGWEPVYHTIAQVHEFTAYLDTLISKESNQKSTYIRVTKQLTDKRKNEIRRWIENEQVLCSCDENYWATHYAYICDEKGDILQFSPRRSQEVFDLIVADFEDLEVAIELLVLKARQVGISTRTALKFLHRLMFLSNTQAVMASAQADKSELIARILNICFERCPWWLIPQRIRHAVGKLMEFSNGSVLSVQSGAQATGIAQGWTPTAIHISELADIPNPKKSIEEGLLRATHPSRKLFQVHEGTGGGNTGWLADTWRAAKEDYPRGMSRFCPVFISWPLATDLYPEADWIRKFPVPESWQPCEETRKHVVRCQLYIRSTPYLSRLCGENWTMPRDQQWFWEFNYLTAVKARTTRTWLSQMPADDLEALTGKNDPVFDQDVIQVRDQERDRAYRAYAIVGTTIEEEFEVEESQIDWDAERIPLHWESPRGMAYDWVLIPLLPFDELNERDALDKLLVFEEPKDGRDYSIGIDTADGLGHEEEDRAVICVTNNAKGNFPDVQVAEWVSNRVNPPQTVGFAAAIGAWFNPKCRDPRGVKFCIEQRMRPGDDCQHQLKLMGFTYHHDMRRYDKKNVNKTKGSQQGWLTGEWSRRFMLNRFVDAVSNGWYKPNSPFLIREMADFERRFLPGGKSKMDHQTGKHDDRIWGAGLSYITRHDMDIAADRSQKKYSPAVRQPEINRDRSNLGVMSVGD